ncbi:2370_t:CDS:2 [Paraglomus occultum]|uniref:2370_t:CDS:1 n=1 Tax=Paraglomus occultum TaxID=144539 RepID=A0A9N9A605_9GLOM|nr:2370_t:CDS:2 [Paraglomus occultum]
MDPETPPSSSSSRKVPRIKVEVARPAGDPGEKRKSLRLRARRSKSVGGLSQTDDSPSDDGTTDDAALVSPRIFRRTNVKKESFDDFIKRRRNVLEKERSTISLYTSPILVLTYFLAYIWHQTKEIVSYARSRKWILTSVPALILFLKLLMLVEGVHQVVIHNVQSLILWYVYWIGLGIASSVGLGTGLHTFVLFLGPHIAEVTWVAYTCGNLDFDTQGPDRFRCKSETVDLGSVTLWRIFRRVQWESFFWGLGTAIGELPPYFVARAAALSGSRSEELATIDKIMEQDPDSISYKERVLVYINRLMQRLGFWGIFLFASIPNPLFDLAGIICGQFLVPFSTFFGATFLGKAVVKSTIQTTIVILLFSQNTLDALLETTKLHFPYLHDRLEKAVEKQLRILRRSEGVEAPDDGLVNITSV